MTFLDSNILEGIILKGIGGFYYVEAADGVYECKAKGIFRKKKVTPLAGDRVRITIHQGEISEHEGEEYNSLDEILPRRNDLRRPPVANIDQLIIVVSSCEPVPNLLLVDRLTCMAVRNGIEPVIVLNKADLKEVDDLAEIYSKTPFRTIRTCGKEGQGVDELRELLPGKISAFTGNTGVGKSTLLNWLDPALELETGEISQKLGRGRHTTRESVLLKTCGGYVADTPGFASLEFEKNDVILKDELSDCFPEFEPYIPECKFYPSCAHMGDKGCAVVQAVKDGKISESRYNSYKMLFSEVKDLREWNLK